MDITSLKHRLFNIRRNRFNADILLRMLSKTMASAMHTEQLAQRILSILCVQMNINSASVLLVKKGRIVEMIVHKMEHFDLSKTELDLLDTSSPMIFDELHEGKKKEFLREHNLSITLPLRTKDHTVGILLLGPKTSGNTYDAKDLDVLNILAPELAVALENAEGVERIRRFNVTLQKEVKKATESLRRANSRLRGLDKLKDEFVSMASHDLATPLSAVKGYLWMLQKKHPTPKERHEYLSHATNATERLLALVNDMLDVSRIEGGRMVLKPENIYLPKLVLEVKEELGPKLSGGKVTLTIEADKAYTVKADRANIHQVLVNLIGNAIKYSPNGGKIVVSFSDHDGFIQTAVADSGIGMKKNEMDLLFTKFGRLSNSGSGSTQIHGTGLGLYICKRTVELSGGNIWAESQEGKGSIFFFTLPRK